MNSQRILLSDKHGHQALLSEQEIGIALHALAVLRVAFDLESEYAKLIDCVRNKFSSTLTGEAVEL